MPTLTQCGVSCLGKPFFVMATGSEVGVTGWDMTLLLAVRRQAVSNKPRHGPFQSNSAYLSSVCVKWRWSGAFSTFIKSAGV